MTALVCQGLDDEEADLGMWRWSCGGMVQHNVEVMAKLQGRTPEELIEEVNQREARGEAIKGKG